MKLRSLTALNPKVVTEVATQFVEQDGRENDLVEQIREHLVEF